MMATYHNVNTGDVHSPEPGSWMAERLAGLPETWQPIDDADPADSAELPAAVVRPVKTARKAEWVDYAMSRGYTRADAESLSRDDLARLFDDENNE